MLILCALVITYIIGYTRGYTAGKEFMLGMNAIIQKNIQSGAYDEGNDSKNCQG